jgi:chromate transporter
MHNDLVEKKRWISNGMFLHALSHCMLLPGPEAQQLAIYIGWKLPGKRGGIVAGTLFVLPSIFVLLALSMVYVSFGIGFWRLVDSRAWVNLHAMDFAGCWRFLISLSN